MSNIEKIKAEIERQKSFIEGLFIEGDSTFYDGQDDAYNHLLAFIDSLPEDDIPKIEGWIARNKDGSLVFCYHKPHRENSITQEWWGSCDADFRIYDNTIDEQFKDLKWEDEPREVELIIKCGTCKDSLQGQETCKENQDSFTDEPKEMSVDDAMKYIDEKIAKTRASKSWEGVDVDKFMDEIRGREDRNDDNLPRLTKDYYYGG